jgi:hypothetical protein
MRAISGGAIMNPKARTEGLLVEELDGEAVVYDLDTDMVHRLDRRAFQVWRSCDGHQTIEMIAKAMSGEQQGQPLAANRLAVVEAAVHQLQEAGLLLSAEKDEAIAKREPTRRQLLATAGTVSAAAGGLTLVQSIAAPTPAMAASVEVIRTQSGGCEWEYHRRTRAWSCFYPIGNPSPPVDCEVSVTRHDGVVVISCHPETPPPLG